MEATFLNLEKLKSIIDNESLTVIYNNPKEKAIEQLKEWTKSKQAEEFLDYGVINGYELPNDKLFEAYSNIISNEVNPIDLIDNNSYKRPSKKEVERFNNSEITNKDMKIQVSFPSNQLKALLNNNGVWSESSLFYQNIDNTGHIDSYCEYDVVSKRTFTISLGKLYSSSIEMNFSIRERFIQDMSKGDIDKLIEISKNVYETHPLLNQKLGIELH